MNNFTNMREAQRLIETSPHHLKLVRGLINKLRLIITNKKNYTLELVPQILPTFNGDRKNVAVMMVKMVPIINPVVLTAIEVGEAERLKKEMSERMIYIDALDEKDRYTVMFQRPLIHHRQPFETSRQYRFTDDVTMMEYPILAMFNFLLHGTIPM